MSMSAKSLMSAPAGSTLIRTSPDGTMKTYWRKVEVESMDEQPDFTWRRLDGLGEDNSTFLAAYMRRIGGLLTLTSP
jgi:hypothetical protein